jgi:hypothetical protein
MSQYKRLRDRSRRCVICSEFIGFAKGRKTRCKKCAIEIEKGWKVMTDDEKRFKE